MLMTTASHLPAVDSLVLDASGLDVARTYLARQEGPAWVTPGLLIAAATSSLYRSGDRSALDGLHHPSPAESSRLLAKARVLFEHCLDRDSSVCVIGFFEHSLPASRPLTGVVAEAIDWMVGETCEMAAGAGDEGQEERPRLRLAREMIDVGISLLHGLHVEEAFRLAGFEE